MSSIAVSHSPALAPERGVWSRVAPFLALTFGLTWLLDLAILLRGGLAQPSTLAALQLQMLIPAASVILLGLFSVRYGSARVRESAGQARWFFYFFLAFTLVFVAITAISFASPELAPTLAGAGSALAVLSVLALLIFRFAKGRASFARAGLTFGKPVQWLTYGLGFVGFYSVMAALNYVFGLGSAPDLAPFLAATPMPVGTFMVVAAIQTVVVGALLGLVITFGEEFGWRSFLQGELVKIGRVRGVLAVGIIWGLWHAPIIAMGYNFPGYPIAGIFMMIAFCVALGFVLGYAMLKTGSIWLSAFLHAISNEVVAFIVMIIYVPRDPIFQFDGGIYGVLAAAVIVALILRDPIWKVKEAASPSAPIAAHSRSEDLVAADK